MDAPLILRARVVLPVSESPIEDGAVVVWDGQVSAVGRWSDLAEGVGSANTVDLGAAILMPGLVNAHCHLDYTDMAGFLPPTSFPDWVKGMLACKAGWSYTEFAQSWLNGANMLERSGTTTVANIEAVPELLPELWTTTPLRVCSFLELTCVKSRRQASALLSEAAERIFALKPERGFMGLSPHALYSTTPEFLELAGELSRRENWLVTTHVSESSEEFEMVLKASGAMFEWLKKQRNMSDCGSRTPVQQLNRCGLLNDRFIAVHANYLQTEDIRALAESGSSVVHCPRSHSYFGYDPFPYAELSKADVNVCLGTDSLASVNRVYGNKPELSMFAEMGVFAARNPSISTETLVRMATRNGARALGMSGQVGEISPGSFADLIAIPFNGPVSKAWDAVVATWRDVSAAMIGGRWVVAPII